MTSRIGTETDCGAELHAVSSGEDYVMGGLHLSRDEAKNTRADHVTPCRGC